MAGDDRILSTARYQAGDGDAAQAFPLGGDTSAPTFSAVTPRALTAAELQPETSLFQFDVPAGRTLYVGRLDRIAGMTPAQIRARWFPLVGGTQRTYTLTDEHQPNVGFLADATGDLTVSILEAAFLGGGAA
jgi:hypothetical protein